METIHAERILLTGATGNVGLETLRALMKRPDKAHFDVIAGLRTVNESADAAAVKPDGTIALDFGDERTFDAALTGVSRVLLIRPPQLADVDRYFKPFVQAMKRANVQQVVFLSLQGVESNPVTPHHKIEKLIVEADLPFTFLRPSFFMQNLSTTHRDEIRLRDELFIPAGTGKTSFVDVRDIGAVAALALTDQSGQFINQRYELTGQEALTYGEIADVLTEVLGRKITYRDPSVWRFIWQKWWKEKMPLGFVMVMVALYTVSKLGKASHLTPTTGQLLGRPPLTFRQFAEAYKSVWTR